MYADKSTRYLQIFARRTSWEIIVNITDVTNTNTNIIIVIVKSL